MHQNLPDSWVKSLFARLQVRYGSEWTRKWEGVDIAAVQEDWANELGGFGSNPDALKRALDNLPPGFPPTVDQFRALCIGAPGDVYDKPKRLDAPSASPEVIAAIRSIGPKSDVDPKAWAWTLRRREMECDRLTAAQRSMWRESLKAEMARTEA